MIVIEHHRAPERLLQIGDLHLQSRELADQKPVLDWVVEKMGTSVDVLVVCGDLAGLACPHLSRPAERQALVDFVVAVVELGTKVIVVRGNHDVPADWAFLNAIDGVWWFDRPETVVVKGPVQGELAVHVLPYPDRSWIADRVDSAEDATQLMGEALKAILVGFDAEGAACQRQVLTGHLNTRGALASTGQPMIGTEVEVATDLFTPMSIPLVLLNHIHLGQEEEKAGTCIVHVGSPWPTTYGEREEKRIADVQWQVGNKLPSVVLVPTPCIRRETIDLVWDTPQRTWECREGWLVTDGVRVRLRLTYDEGEDVDVRAAEALVPGAHAIKIERCPIPRRRERSPEVVRATDPVKRFVAYEESEGREVDEALRSVATELVSLVG